MSTSKSATDMQELDGTILHIILPQISLFGPNFETEESPKDFALLIERDGEREGVASGTGKERGKFFFFSFLS